MFPEYMQNTYAKFKLLNRMFKGRSNIVEVREKFDLKI